MKWAALACWAVVAAAFVNATRYTYAVANPMLASDNWGFLEIFLREAIEGRLEFADFLVKRAAVDHAQPLNKLLMWLDYRLFGLDFKLEAMVGILFMMLGFGVLYWAAKPARRTAAFYLAIAAVAAIYASLNSSGIYTDPLVTLGFVDYFFAFLMIHCGWLAIQGGHRWWLAGAAVAYGIVGDQSAILAMGALAVAAGLYGLRHGNRRNAAILIGIVAAALVASRLFYGVFGEIRGGPEVTAFDAGLWHRISSLIDHAGDAWRWIVTPAASGVAYSQSLQYLFGIHWTQAQVALGLLVAACNVWFWREAWRRPPAAAAFMAVCLMLLCYAYVAGLLFGRAFVGGSDYLDQPRYVSFYQFNIIALLLMGAARAQASPGSRDQRIFLGACVVLLLLQIPLTRHAWMEVKHIDAYYLRMARDFGRVARDPTAPPPVDCPRMLLLCEFAPEERRRAVALLTRHRLNLYSPRFARAYPGLVAAAGDGSP